MSEDMSKLLDDLYEEDSAPIQDAETRKIDEKLARKLARVQERVGEDVVQIVDGEVIVDDKEFFKRDEKGRFGKGNGGSLPSVGDSNHGTHAIREELKRFTMAKALEMWDLWGELEPKDQAALFCKIVRLVVPQEREGDETSAPELTINLVEAKPKQ